jgi:predicted acetyltransferase
MEIEEISEKNAPAFLAMIEDYKENDPTTFSEFYDRPWSAKEFAKFAKECAKQKQDWRPAAKKTSVTRYVMPGKFGEILANAVMRFPLDETLEIDGGNIHVDVSPKLRRHGYGSYCLALMLFEAVRAGLRRVLVTCREDDLGARKMIEKNRGVLEDVVASTREDRKGARIARYWIRFS